MEDRLEYLEAAVGALAGYVPVQDLKENEGWKSLEDHVLKVSTKVSQIMLEDAKAYVEMETAAQAKKSEAVFASTWEKALKQVGSLEAKLEEINMLRREITALDVALKARGRELFEVRRATEEKYASKSQVEDVQLALGCCAPAADVAGLRVENEAVREAVAAAEAEVLRLCEAFEELQFSNKAQAGNIVDQFRETKEYMGAVSAETVKREQAAELIARQRQSQLFQQARALELRVDDCCTKAAHASLKEYASHFVRDHDIIVLRDEVLPACEAFSKQVRAFKLDNTHVKESVRRFDALLCQKVNKSRLLEVEEYVQRTYMQKAELEAFVESQTQRALVREREAEALATKIKDFQANLESNISKVCDGIITEKLYKYERVASSFAQFFCEGDLATQLRQKVDCLTFDKYREEQVTKAHLAEMQSMVETVNHRLQQLSVLHAEVAALMVPSQASSSFTATENVNTKILKREYIAKQSKIAARWILDTPIGAGADGTINYTLPPGPVSQEQMLLMHQNNNIYTNNTTTIKQLSSHLHQSNSKSGSKALRSRDRYNTTYKSIQSAGGHSKSKFREKKDGGTGLSAALRTPLDFEQLAFSNAMDSGMERGSQRTQDQRSSGSRPWTELPQNEPMKSRFEADNSLKKADYTNTVHFDAAEMPSQTVSLQPKEHASFQGYLVQNKQRASKPEQAGRPTTHNTTQKRLQTANTRHGPDVYQARASEDVYQLKPGSQQPLQHLGARGGYGTAGAAGALCSTPAGPPGTLLNRAGSVLTLGTAGQRVGKGLVLSQAQQAQSNQRARQLHRKTNSVASIAVLGVRSCPKVAQTAQLSARQLHTLTGKASGSIPGPRRDLTGTRMQPASQNQPARSSMQSGAVDLVDYQLTNIVAQEASFGRPSCSAPPEPAQPRQEHSIEKDKVALLVVAKQAVRKLDSIQTVGAQAEAGSPQPAERHPVPPGAWKLDQLLKQEDSSTQKSD